jgi:glucose-6-phosphate 1-dehydrogenase
MSGTIPSMETLRNDLKDNTIIVVLGASGDLEKKKDDSCSFRPLSLGPPSSRLQDRWVRQNEDGSG